MDWEEIERQVAAKCQGLLSDVAITHDAWIRDKLTTAHDGWLETTDLFIRIKSLTNDEAVIAKAVRKFASEYVQISEDGRYMKPRNGLPDFAEIDARTLYIEYLPPKSTPDSIHAILTSLDIPPPLPQIYIDLFKKDQPMYAFATFQTEDQAVRALPRLNKFETLNQHNWKNGILNNTRKLRAVTKKEWLKRMAEYRMMLQSRLEKVCPNPLELPPVDERAGLVAEYTGVHPEASRNTVKKLFGLVAPLAFIEHQHGTAVGYLRFKTVHGAQIARLYFARESVIQRTKNDLGSLLMAHEKSSNGVDASVAESQTEGTNMDVDAFPSQNVSGARNIWSRPKVITLRFLTGEEELQYWNKIGPPKATPRYQTCQTNTVPASNLISKAVVARQSRPSVKPAGKHIRFDDTDSSSSSDSDDEANAKVVPAPPLLSANPVTISGEEHVKKVKLKKKKRIIADESRQPISQQATVLAGTDSEDSVAGKDVLDTSVNGRKRKPENFDGDDGLTVNKRKKLE
ncbi:hypothetical protein SeMB42_g02277 [Synchytrium endobioticum]|uniref:HTH La-type RNA-binding domain-containing protein n=1 Tax=Synchytrium endobioticum TaxID=286115 RepID=A0A507CUY4_9FUNG|nr:hypothetical protein SeLEV6574_g05340 [Synchytrium endobioticum]TPX50372.1 hypothetical protein SeMB42_g02277 [Synchytrium endobioticum]